MLFRLAIISMMAIFLSADISGFGEYVSMYENGLGWVVEKNSDSARTEIIRTVAQLRLNDLLLQKKIEKRKESSRKKQNTNTLEELLRLNLLQRKEYSFNSKKLEKFKRDHEAEFSKKTISH